MPGVFSASYDGSIQPSIPVVEGFLLRLEAAGWVCPVTGIVDSGCDVSLVPENLDILVSEYCKYGWMDLRRPGDDDTDTYPTVELGFEIPGVSFAVNTLPFVVLGGEVVIGRDILNALRVALDGITPAGPTLKIEGP
ncbi:MAG TPA: hypothetical protein VMZ06_17375 [Candidatus Bathyarchaeia archaeon]|nr:hypothetical protein [Candidatus Bathyarchaeia archaeon]